MSDILRQEGFLVIQEKHGTLLTFFKSREEAERTATLRVRPNCPVMVTSVVRFLQNQNRENVQRMDLEDMQQILLR